MTDNQNITQAIRQAAIEATKAAILMMAVTRNEAGAEPRSEPISMAPKLGRSALKQLTSGWSATDKYTELRNFRLEVNTIFLIYNINNTEYQLSKSS